MPSQAVQAAQDWNALASRCLVRGRNDDLLVREGFGRAAAVWPTSQVISATLVRVAVEAEAAAESELQALDRGLQSFRTATYFAESRRGRNREVYYDDNAWLALNYLEQALLVHTGAIGGDATEAVATARGILELLRQGQSPSGGVLWKVGGDTLNACSTAPAGLVALRIVEAETLIGTTNAYDHTDLIEFAQRCAAFIETFRRSDGLVADHSRPDGSTEPSIYSYNQGTSLGLFVQLARLAGDSTALVQATEIAQASVAYYSTDDRLWRESPAFVALYLRHLALLRAHTATKVGADIESAWLNRLTDARDPGNGFYTEGGIGHYDGSVSLDQAGSVAARYVAALPAELVPLLC